MSTKRIKFTKGKRLRFAINREARTVKGGYQLWQTTDEPPRAWPDCPVFESIEALSEWATDNATTFADMKVSREEWLAILR